MTFGSTINDGYSLRAALRTPAFWVFGIGAALYGLVASGIGLFNESILAERGLGVDTYYYTLVVTAMTGLAGNFLGGWLAGSISLNRLMALSLFVWPSAGALLISRRAMAMQVRMLGSRRPRMVFIFSVWPRVYGRRQLGRIQGVAQALTVVASAVGPLLLATCIQWTGSYRSAFFILAASVSLFGFAALVVPLPNTFQNINRAPN